jgi:hypothetical protein
MDCMNGEPLKEAQAMAVIISRAQSRVVSLRSFTRIVGNNSLGKIDADAFGSVEFGDFKTCLLGSFGRFGG